MIGYVMVGTNDLARAQQFYDALMAEFGAKPIMAFEKSCGYGRSMDQPMLAVTKPYDGQPATVGNGVMVALMAESRAMVDAVHAKALALGGQDEGAPGPRGDEAMGFYGAYFRDLDGNKLAVFKMG